MGRTGATGGDDNADALVSRSQFESFVVKALMEAVVKWSLTNSLYNYA